jgi:transcriptional regulator with XRE-family HTH domain
MPPPDRKPPVAEILRVLGARLRQRRIERDLSLEELSARSGVSWSMIGHIERGQQNTTLIVLARIAEGLDSDLGDFMHNLPKPPASEPRARRRPLRP